MTTADTLPQELLDHYRSHGFVKIPQIISREEAEHYRQACLAFTAAKPAYNDRPVFSQHVNIWRDDETVRELTLHPNVAAVAQKLATVKLRLWHDHCLIKRPHNATNTELHQDQAYWPHANSVEPISAWIALCDVPPERGCMTFIPGSWNYRDLPSQNLSDPRSFFGLAPDMEWAPRVTLPLQAGDCTFHHGRTAHMATPNHTGVDRVAHVIIYMDATTTFSGGSHVVTKPLDFREGDLLDGEMFPTVDSMIARHSPTV